jgi:glycyl-tRNA synthetase
MPAFLKSVSIWLLFATFDLIHLVFAEKTLIRAGVSNKVDDSGVTVGKRYARTDECGIPFAITVDFDTLQDDTVTLRDLASMKQIRLPIADVPGLILNLSNTISTWEDAVAKYGLFVQPAKDAEEKKE